MRHCTCSTFWRAIVAPLHLNSHELAGEHFIIDNDELSHSWYIYIYIYIYIERNKIVTHLFMLNKFILWEFKCLAHFLR